jgi:hypothetical protein
MSEYNLYNFYAACCNGTLCQVKKLCPKFVKTKIIKSQYTKAFLFACANGNLKVTQWLLETNVNIIKKISEDPVFEYHRILSPGNLLWTVCNNGFVNVATWLYDNVYCKIKPKANRINILKKNLKSSFRIEVIEWVLNLPINVDCSDYVRLAMLGNKLSLIQKMHFDKGMKITPWMFYLACDGQHIDIASWMVTIDENFSFVVDGGIITSWKVISFKDRLLLTLEQKKDIRKYFDRTSRSLQTECIICCDDAKYFLEYNCKHIFCINCSLVATTQTCPYCRGQWSLSDAKLLISSSCRVSE